VFCVLVSRCLLALFFRLRIRGRENVRPDGAYIAVARHRSYWDILVVAAALGVRNRIHFIARKGLLKAVPIVQPLIRAYSTIIDRDHFGIADFRRMLEAVRRERLVFIFPEGTTRHRVDAKGGAVYFASAAGKRILPINIQAVGPYPPKYPFRFPRITVSIGKAFDPVELGDDGAGTRSDKLRDMSEALMARVDSV
jgi:1-acyl-sn-glycerol-3-phosphate acyltransferase